MRYYKFNRNRSIFSLHRYGKSLKKMSYMINTNRSKLLDSFYYENQTWGALHKAWKGYIIAKNKQEYDRREYYAAVIQKLQSELGLRVSSFPDIGLSTLKFYSSRCSNKRSHLSDNNYGDDTEAAKQESSLQDNDESEYFEGDFNNTDRFTS
jgi:hypothetical protein